MSRKRPSLTRLAGDLFRGFDTFLDQRFAYEQGRAPATMPLLYLDLTSSCNLRCIHCGFASGYRKEGKVLEARDWKRIMDDSLELSTQVVSFCGGEPFLRQDIFELLDHAKQRGLFVQANTNATLLDEDNVRKLADASHLTLILSLDHPDPDANDAIRGAGVFTKVVRAAKLLKEYAPEVRVGINCVIGPYNLGELVRMVELGAAWGLEAVKFTPAHGNLNHAWKPGGLDKGLLLKPEHLPALKRELKQVLAAAKRLGVATNSAAFFRLISNYVKGSMTLPCYAGYLYGNVDPYGNLFPCYDHQVPLNVSEIGLVEAWYSPAMAAMRDNVRHCNNNCWNTGNAEPSIRMNLGCLMRDPLQVIADMSLYTP